MPELPEVETIVRQLNKKVKGFKLTDAWTDWPKTIKTHSLPQFRKEIKGREILHVKRRAKYIIIKLSGHKTMAIHQKISGHLLYGKWIPRKELIKLKDKELISKIKNNDKFDNQKWLPAENGPLADDPFNRHIRFILFLNNGKMIGLSDLRRFGKIYLADNDKIGSVGDIGRLGPEPLDPKFTFKKFKELFKNKKGKVKQVLMDPFFIAGIGNIYSDEILWYSGILPTHRVESLDTQDLKKIYKYIKFVLKKAIKAKGDSEQDYRKLDGTKGDFQNMTKAYQKTGQKCSKNDGGIIKRLKVGGRSAHYCPIHQK
ncbi:MAG: bifunctional DNA-formamidopyrimidine glycosylase/DNA-(apurinic or apyrimidinic site) lyase [Candidatus Yanofskybacteria bacterium CG10_big_fil_rev_8_21_14_0_10_36_16]|uniref:Bifunctional DNA-formamidopyrimidine glycosylase/DNA-(Apurinic or apyrimidinic site) lyase n=1 Tax=Candidatus Yanofskybacteria bacterium CG10_big_fil_rev_8_21_14_0_10_36_16 TaxID=1975096 RepID=A0A2J0Q7W8_9BACT|nr:MAG: bifunctional DNA-formamidopyrimidine glycosylase/DNA-(apurinic or apyrimidinic site) lyase [Candidatus Yanofskybacteria bacterium CG10_big_fil_rev_8_21_14_0_10_36_16]